MIKNKKPLIASGVILIICMLLYFPYPDNQMIYARSTFMSFPISDQEGYNVLAIIGSFLYIFAIVLLVSGLSKYHIRTVIIISVVYIFLPLGLIKIYQETLANGIAAVSYDEKGTCDFKGESKDRMVGECHLRLHNHSEDPVTFELEFLDTFFPEEGHRMNSLMNENGPLTITIEANREKTVKLKELLDLSDIPNHIDSGSSSEVHFIIKDGDKERVM